jgi:predicted acylesterase/phospholipase RssA
MDRDRRAPLAVAYGGGGLFGIAYTLGVAEALVDRGVPLAAAPALGTSAGSWTAAGLALGVHWTEAIDNLAHDIPRRPDMRAHRLRNLAARLFGEACAPTIKVVVTELPRLRRVLLDGADHAVADLVAASSAVPGLLAPHRIGARLYVDGGVRSLTSADLAAPADNLLVVAPLAGPMYGPIGWRVEQHLRREMSVWARTNPGGRTWLIRPSHQIAALARRPDRLFDPDRARECFALARTQGHDVAERWALAEATRDKL